MNSGIEISRMTLGTAQLGMEYGIANTRGRPDEEKALNIIEEAVNNGVNCLDTAAAYGDSEEVIGKYLKLGKKKREEILIVTKVKIGSGITSGAEKRILESVERSVERLCSTYIDVLLLHDAKEYLIFPDEINRTFERLVLEGIVHKAGASFYDAGEIVNFIDNDLFQAFQIPVNLLGGRIKLMNEYVKPRNILIFARSIFLQGLFFMDPNNLRGNLREAGVFIKRIREIASELNTPVTELAIRYVNSLNNIDSLVIGADDPSHVTENIDYLQRGKMPEETLALIEERLKGVPSWLLKPYLWDKQK